MKLATIDDIETYLEKSDPNQYPLLNLILESVSASIQDYLNRYLVKQEYTEYFEGGHRYYFLPAYPVDTTAPITVTVDGSDKTQDSDYYLSEQSGIIEFKTEPPAIHPKIVKVVWTGGYTQSSDGLVAVPEPIKYACIIQTVHNYRRRRDSGLNAISMPNGSLSITEKGVLLEQVKGLLRPYRRKPTA